MIGATRNRTKTRRLIEAAGRGPIEPATGEAFGRLKRLEKLGYLRRVREGWIATGKPYQSPQAIRAAETTFDFEAHRRRWNH